jgi:hypothetical protein
LGLKKAKSGAGPSGAAYEWEDGTPISFKAWAQSFPSCTESTATDVCCVFSSDNKWEDSSKCGTEVMYGTVCELPLVTDKDLETLLRQLQAQATDDKTKREALNVKIEDFKKKIEGNEGKIKAHEEDISSLQSKATAGLGISIFLLIVIVFIVGFAAYKFR